MTVAECSFSVNSFGNNTKTNQDLIGNDEPDLVEVVEMHHGEADLRDGLVRPADLGMLPDQPGDRFPDAADGEEDEQDQHDDPIHAAAAVRLTAEYVPEKKINEGSFQNNYINNFEVTYF